jgi:integrase
MKDTGLLTCPRTGQDRTLYSLRHTYATFSLLNDGMDVHTLAVQMGTSILMIERHYLRQQSDASSHSSDSTLKSGR